MAYHPLPMTHVGLTVTDIAAATCWYQDVLRSRHTIGPLHIRHDGSHIGEVFKGIFGGRFEEGYACQLATANGVGIELFQFVAPLSEPADDNFRCWKTSVFHFCFVDPEIEALAERIAEHGGRQRSAVWTLFEGEPFKAVYCEDPWGA
jgi:catechol 2,3-dioxygenase-like lactoylglutathione lyase family enzyme